jgi:hypothetical protein
MLNVVCHLPKLGYKRYATADDSVNVWWVAVLAMGEGWHNNHHACPGSARSGLRPWEFDLSWLIIASMKALKLVRRVNECSHYGLLRIAALRRRAANPAYCAEQQTFAGGNLSGLTSAATFKLPTHARFRGRQYRKVNV